MSKHRFIILQFVCVLLTFLIFSFVLMIGYVPSASMEPALKKGRIILALRLYGELETGDVVVFRYDGKLHVKRIAATSGEVVEHNGKFLAVPDGCYYLLGDNKNDSYDSRYWDDPFVKRRDIIAKVI